MFQNFGIANLLSAQVRTPADEFALEFLSGPQFFIALIAGVVMAFAFQFLLSNFSIATGISAGINPSDTDAKGWGKKIRRIEAKVGSATLFIVNVALFIACFLAVKLTLIQDAGLAAIVAVVIWSVYFLLLLWTSSQAIGSVIGAVGSTAGSGLQGVIAMAATALSGQAANSQITNTVEASVEAVAKELRSTLNSDRLRENLEDHVAKLRLPQPNLKNVPDQALNLLGNSALPSVNSSELFDLLKSATSEDLASGKLRERLTQMLGFGQAANGKSQSNGESSTKQGVGLRERTLQMGTDALIAALAKRSGLSGFNVENLTKSLSSLGQQIGDQASKVAGQASRPPSLVIRSDVENYLLNSPAWYLRPDSLDQGFREVLFDPDADAELVRQQLEQLNRAYFVEVLNRRDGINPDQVNDIADELELIRREVLDTVHAAEEQERSQALRHHVEAYLSSTPKKALTSDQVQQDFTALLADPEATYETLGNRLLQFDRDRLMQLLLAGRQDLSPEETEQILNQLEGARDRFLNQSQETWNQLQSQAAEFQQQVESYLRETNAAELTPEAIQKTLQMLLEAPGGGLLAMRAGLGQLDRNTLQQTLAQRQDINPEQINQLIDQVEAVRDGILHAPQQLVEQGQEQVDHITNQIGDYLRSTNLEELNPEGIQRDLRTLLADPQTGVSAWQNRLSQVDRETLVKLLSQRQDLSEEQVNRVIDQTLDAIRALVRAPREVAIRTRDRIRDFQTDLANYLRNTNRAELNPEAIQRDLQLLLKHPGTGLEQWGERLSQIDRNTLVSLLSQREDLMEEDANRIIEQIESVRDQLIQQAQTAKDQVKATVNKASERVGSYLNSLEQPELNYEGIQRDIRKLFDDPEAGLEALRQRLSQFDRDTLVAILSSRSDISEAQANKIVDQVEAARDSVLHQAEQLQAKAEERIQALKHQAKEQAEEVQKTVASAAWWLFGTALTSVATAAIAGVLAAGGINLLD
jgi:nucleoid DNA-binding protein